MERSDKRPHNSSCESEKFECYPSTSAETTPALIRSRQVEGTGGMCLQSTLILLLDLYFISVHLKSIQISFVKRALWLSGLISVIYSNFQAFEDVKT